MLFEDGHSDDMRLAYMGMGIAFVTPMGLAELGVTEPLDSGPVQASNGRIAAAQQKSSQG